MSSALEGIKVVEFAGNLGAAYAAMLLAEQGARVLRVELRGAASGRGTPHYHVLNRSKTIVSLDPASVRDEARRLLAAADLVITGSALRRFGELDLDHPALSRDNPRIVALYLPPFGSRGPDATFELAGAEEELVAALGGIAGNQWALSGNPVPLTFPAASYSAGVLGATAAVAALVARGGGAGQAVEVSLLAGAFSLQTGGIMRHQKMTTLYHGPQDPLGPIPCYRLFQASDGGYLFVACGNATFWNKFALALDRPELVADPRFEGAPFGVAEEHRQALKDIIAPIIRTRPRDEWLAHLRAASAG